MERDLTCIGCPMGCSLHVWWEGDVITVTGNNCPRGAAYGSSECTAPVRRFTGTVAVSGGVLPVVSVKTATEIPKDSVLAVAEAVRSIRVDAPVTMGDVIAENIAGTDAALVATKTVPAAE